MMFHMFGSLQASPVREPRIHDREDDGVLMAGVLCVNQSEDSELGGKGINGGGKGWRHAGAGSLKAHNSLPDALHRTGGSSNSALLYTHVLHRTGDSSSTHLRLLRTFKIPAMYRKEMATGQATEPIRYSHVVHKPVQACCLVTSN